MRDKTIKCNELGPYNIVFFINLVSITNFPTVMSRFDLGF
jgi:hypothetical protein